MGSFKKARRTITEQMRITFNHPKDKYTQVPNDVWHDQMLNHRQIVMLGLIFEKAHDNNWGFNHKYFAKCLRCSVGVIKKDFTQLRKAGWLSISQKQVNGYFTDVEYNVNISPMNRNASTSVPDKTTKKEGHRNATTSAPVVERSGGQAHNSNTDSLKRNTYKEKQITKEKVVDYSFFKNLKGSELRYKKLPRERSYYYQHENINEFEDIPADEKEAVLRTVYELNDKQIIDKKLRQKALREYVQFYEVVKGMIKDPKARPAGYLAQTIRNFQ